MKAPSEDASLILMASRLLEIGATGLFATAIYILLFVVLTPELPSLAAHVVAYLVAVALQFLILTFRVFITQAGANVHWSRAGRYVVQIFVVLTLSSAAERLIEMQPLTEAIALAIIITGVNALMYFLWTFRT